MIDKNLNSDDASTIFSESAHITPRDQTMSFKKTHDHEDLEGWNGEIEELNEGKDVLDTLEQFGSRHVSYDKIRPAHQLGEELRIAAIAYTPEILQIRTVLEAQKTDLKKLILADKNELESQLALEDDHLVDRNHPADMVAGDPDYEKNIALSNHHEAELVLIEDALQRIDHGSYGICAECDRPIALPRLKALPFAKLCLDCQRVEELSTTQGSIITI